MKRRYWEYWLKGDVGLTPVELLGVSNAFCWNYYLYELSEVVPINGFQTILLHW